MNIQNISGAAGELDSERQSSRTAGIHNSAGQFAKAEGGQNFE